MGGNQMSLAETVRRTICRSNIRLLYDLSSMIVGAAFIGLFAQIAFPLPFTPVPITGQTLAVLLIGALLGSMRGSLSVILYLAWGSLNLPLFAGGGAGLARLAGPTGGYLVGMIIAAWIVGKLIEAGWGRKLRLTVSAMAIGNVAIYAFGLAGLARFVPASNLLSFGLYPFIIGDLCKVLVAGLALPILSRWSGHRDAFPLH